MTNIPRLLFWVQLIQVSSVEVVPEDALRKPCLQRSTEILILQLHENNNQIPYSDQISVSERFKETKDSPHQCQ